MGAIQTKVVVAAKPVEYPVVRIEAHRGWLALDLGELWAYRDLVYFFVWRDIKVRYKQTVIGAAWAILQPVLTMLIFSLFFGKLAKIPSQGLPYPIFYYSALLPWMYFCHRHASRTKHRRGKSKGDHEDLFSPRGIADFFGSIRAAGFCHFVRSLPGLDGLVSHRAHRRGDLAAVLHPAGGADRSWRWFMALRPQCHVPRRPLRRPIPRAVLDVCLPGGLPSSLVPEKWRWLYGLNPMAALLKDFVGP